MTMLMTVIILSYICFMVAVLLLLMARQWRWQKSLLCQYSKLFWQITTQYQCTHTKTSRFKDLTATHSQSVAAAFFASKQVKRQKKGKQCLGLWTYFCVFSIILSVKMEKLERRKVNIPLQIEKSPEEESTRSHDVSSSSSSFFTNNL